MRNFVADVSEVKVPRCTRTVALRWGGELMPSGSSLVTTAGWPGIRQDGPAVLPVSAPRDRG